MPTVKEEFIGQQFGKAKQVTVVGRSSEMSGATCKYIVHCSKCAEDPELHGTAMFLTVKHSLKKGILPCGCGKSPRWSDSQYALLISRECNARNYTYLGLACDKMHSTAKIKLACKYDGNEWITSVALFLRSGQGCPQCKARKTSDRCLMGDAERIKQFMSSGVFPAGSTFTRCLTQKRYGQYHWQVTCPICSCDEYVKAELCTGVFTTTAASLLGGGRPCRCSSCFKWTQGMQEYRIKRIAATVPFTSFVGWKSTHKGKDSVVIMACSEHSNYTTTASGFINSGRRCPSCSTTGFNPANEGSVYVLRVTGESTGFTGYGISGQVEVRFAVHKRELAREGFKISDSRVFDLETGTQALNIENMLKSRFPKYKQVVTGFRTEATYLDLYEDVVDFIEVEISKEIL